MTSAAVAETNAQVATPDLVVDLARFAATIDAARLDPALIKAVKTNILDTLSCALAGSSAKAIAEVSDLVKEWGGAPQADMFVFGGKSTSNPGTSTPTIVAVWPLKSNDLPTTCGSPPKRRCQ